MCALTEPSRTYVAHRRCLSRAWQKGAQSGVMWVLLRSVHCRNLMSKRDDQNKVPVSEAGSARGLGRFLGTEG